MSSNTINAAICGLYVIETGLSDAFLDGIVFDRFGGTGIALDVTSTDKVIVQLNAGESRVAAFKDNDGKDLLKSPTGEDADVYWETKRIPNDDVELRKRLFVQFSTRTRPNPNATQLYLDVNLEMQLAARLEPRVLKNLSLTPGPVTLDDFDVKITHVGKPELNTSFPFAVQMEMKGPASDLIESVSFVDADGNSLSVASFRAMTEPGRRLVEYYFVEEIQSAEVGFAIWQDLENVEVPFQGDITLGLAPVVP